MLNLEFLVTLDLIFSLIHQIWKLFSFKKTELQLKTKQTPCNIFNIKKNQVILMQLKKKSTLK